MQGMTVTAGMRAGPYIGHVQCFLWLELPQPARRAGRTVRLAVCQGHLPQAAAGLGVAAQLYLIKLDDPCQGLEAKGIPCFDCVLCHSKPKEPAKRKRKRAGEHRPDTADVGKVYLWRCYNLAHMA